MKAQTLLDSLERLKPFLAKDVFTVDKLSQLIVALDETAPPTWTAVITTKPTKQPRKTNRAPSSPQKMLSRVVDTFARTHRVHFGHDPTNIGRISAAVRSVEGLSEEQKIQYLKEWGRIVVTGPKVHVHTVKELITRHVEARGSKKSRLEFCRQHNISPGTYSRFAKEGSQ